MDHKGALSHPGRRHHQPGLEARICFSPLFSLGACRLIPLRAGECQMHWRDCVEVWSKITVLCERCSHFKVVDLDSARESRLRARHK
ncbi:hypothetical protein NEOLEDRAFT_15636 [Neolentinus lepideus HHB14362 ss-1]|uniref:Uncharacterized protein n=1 Tax=Neolentinus lepideus HHB14362 ss-1 TaxID=1314782 RepID=A0A165W1M0_9AGAM|nr:hypothetical protein NEOLEDRAFT_15636 [Neolentinus lepideus HHB14362 ss-1]